PAASPETATMETATIHLRIESPPKLLILEPDELLRHADRLTELVANGDHHAVRLSFRQIHLCCLVEIAGLQVAYEVNKPGVAATGIENRNVDVRAAAVRYEGESLGRNGRIHRHDHCVTQVARLVKGDTHRNRGP